ncbi:hypothetical protein JDV02_010026 [Purpureocillium takamizusanense]|uniref:DNA damage-responsive protein 48 n=1 Tax=Purpureocillium takamizusanense TaxID=2060973 RepID=A0A9Q8QRB8_9HYPO|nr:uncharacterized protein JDV02_010026 [Purpureocillium takamizusanense]UNI24263.1 hypothetical protein JDV02_010026 [Purpureocillium takamizusanense]
MDFVKNLASGGGSNANNNNNNGNNSSGNQPQHSGGGDGGAGSSGGGLMDKFNNLAGGGKQGEANEDSLDKAVDFVQEKFLGKGDQSNESAAEQAKDEAISDFIRDKYKGVTGGDFPIQDKDRKPGF